VPQLTTTSYAILGQLALGDASTYELAKRMGRNMRYFWPRAESRIYEEAKRLVEQGLADAQTTFVGKRRRTTYAITEAGRDALRAWLSTPAASWFSLEAEGLLRLFLADLGTKEDIVAALEGMRDEAIAMLRIGRTIGEEYVAGRSPFQDIVDIRVLVFDFLAQVGLGVVEWAERSLAEVEAWDELTREERAERAVRLIESRIALYPPPEPAPAS
jgi:DNA-binding PadR family transcriptional regulator